MALIFREGPILRSQNIAIVDQEGVEVSRPRAGWRALIAWSPILVHWLLPAPLGDGDGMWFLAALALLAIAVTGVWTAAVRPERALHDRLAGTWFVSR